VRRKTAWSFDGVIIAGSYAAALYIKATGRLVIIVILMTMVTTGKTLKDSILIYKCTTVNKPQILVKKLKGMSDDR